VTDGSFVYWRTEAPPYEIARVSRDGGTPQVLTSGPSPYTSIVLDGTTIWFTRQDGIVGSVPISGGAETPILTSEVSPTSIVVDETLAYFIANKEIVSRSKGGGGARLVLATPTTFGKPDEGFSSADPTALGLAPSHVLVKLEIQGLPAGIARLPKGIGAPQVFTTPFVSAIVFDARDGGHAYVGEHDPSTKWSAIARVSFGQASTGSDVRTIGQYDVSTIARDNTHVYWTSRLVTSGEPSGNVVLRRIPLP
jgi:hypothetical protein